MTTRTPANPPLQRTDASVAPLPRASAAERQGRWADTMNNVYFACEGCRMMVDAGYRWAYWELEHHGVVQRRKAVSVEAVLATAAYWAPDAEPPSKWLTDEVLPAVRLFLDVHSSHQVTYGDVEEIVGDRSGSALRLARLQPLAGPHPTLLRRGTPTRLVGQSARVGEDARSTAMVVGRSGTHGTRQGEIPGHCVRCPTRHCSGRSAPSLCSVACSPLNARTLAARRDKRRTCLRRSPTTKTLPSGWTPRGTSQTGRSSAVHSSNL